MKFLNIFLLFLMGGFCLNAQNVKLDSLNQLLNHTKNDIDRVELLNVLADEYKTVNPKLLEQYALQALTLATQIKHNEAIGNAKLSLGNASIIKGDYKKALFYFEDAQTVFEEELRVVSKSAKSLKTGLAKAFGGIGIVFSEQSNYSKALQFYLKSVKIYESQNDRVQCAKLYNNIGVAYRSQKLNFKALEYFVKAQKIQEQLDDSNLGITYTNIGNEYLAQNNLSRAFEYYQKAEKQLMIFQNLRAYGELQNNLGIYYQKTASLDKAILSWQKAIDSFTKINDQFGITDTYLLLAEYFLTQNQAEKTIQYAEKAYQTSSKVGVLEQKMLAQEILSRVYEKLNKADKAYYHYKQYQLFRDSILNEENIRKSLQEEMNYEFDKRDALHKSELEKKEILLQEQTKRNQLQLIFGALLILLLFGIGFLIYNRIQLKKTLTLQKELAEYEQKALHLQMNPHFVFNCLGSISSFIVQNGTDTAVKYLAKFSKLMRLTLEYSKESLIPIDKEIESLQNYLELEQLRFNNKFSFIIEKDPTIEDDLALPPLLIQPFVENAIVHGIIPTKEQGTISIVFQLENDFLSCIIEDNGIGYWQSKKAKERSVVAHKSMAIDIIKKRLEMMHSVTGQRADVKIEELTDSGGTRVILLLPIQYLN